MYAMGSIISGFGIFIAVALTVAGMILLYLKVLPKKFDGTFTNKFMQIAHDYFNFKKLYLESVLKFLFTLLTVVCIAAGAAQVIVSFFGVFQNLVRVIEYGMSFMYVISAFFGGVLGGVLTIVVGPIIVRLVYEGIMMFIILVKNVIEINNKTKSPADKEEEQAE